MSCRAHSPSRCGALGAVAAHITVGSHLLHRDDSRPPKFNSLSLGTFVRLEAAHAAASFAPVHRSLLLQSHQRAHVIAADPCGYIQSDPATVAVAGASMPLHVRKSTLTSAVVHTTSSAPAASWGVVSSFASLRGNTALRQVVMAPPTCFVVVSRSASDSQTRIESKTALEIVFQALK